MEEDKTGGHMAATG